MLITEYGNLSATVPVEDTEKGFIWRVTVLDIYNMAVLLQKKWLILPNIPKLKAPKISYACSIRNKEIEFSKLTILSLHPCIWPTE